MTTCEVCRWDYPNDYVSTYHASDCRSGKEVCGVCALELSNQTHGAPTRASFAGAKAESYRQMAINWRAAHPEHAPTQAPKGAS